MGQLLRSDQTPCRDVWWRRDPATPPPSEEVLRKLLKTWPRRKSRLDGPSPSDRPERHTERPEAAAAC